MKKSLLKLTLLFLIICSGLSSSAQTFNCYIANDRLVSSTIYEFDEYIVSTSNAFNLRSVQNCFTFNPAFFNSSATITVTLVAGSSQLNSYSISPINWSASASGFQTPSNTGGICANGTLISSTTPVRVGTFRIESTLPFNCVPPNPNMIRQGDPTPSGLVLWMAVSKWNSLDCSTPGTSPLNANGTFTQHTPRTLYDEVNNLVPQITAQPNNASACNAGLVTFSVTVAGSPGMSTPVSYQWYDNGVAVTNGASPNGTFAGATSSSMTITSPSASLNGHQFYCIITQCNTDTTVSVTVTSSANDNNACTTDACDPVTGIVTNTPVNTDDGNPCTTDACDPVSGSVSHQPINSDDGDGCTTDGCDPITGIFHNPVIINDNDPCTTDACDPATGNVTHNPAITNDSNACTIDGCDPVTGVYHTSVNTNDNNMCTVDACDPVTGNITHTPLNTDDGNACTIDGCDQVTGVFHNAVPIDDGDACTLDHCNTTTGTINHVPLDPDDGNACTTDGCDPVTGIYNTHVNIDDGIACTLDQCDTITGNITHTNITSASPALTVNNQCGFSVITATGFTGTLLWNTGETTSSITVTTAGLYSVTQNISGCVSPPGSISASPLSLPVVDLGGDTLVQAASYVLDPGAGFLTYQWSTGATTQSITVQNSGWFWVTVTNSSCPATDSVFVDFFLGIGSSAENSIRVFPNPSSGYFNVYSSRTLRDVTISLYDVAGREVEFISEGVIPENSQKTFTINQAKGIYIMRITTLDGVIQKQLIIQ